MFAVIRTGGKQYKVAKDETLDVEKLDGAPGETVTFGEVLMVVDGTNANVGAPTLSGASVTAEIVETYRGEKVIAFKKRRRKDSRKKKGHRQTLTRVKITGIAAA